MKSIERCCVAEGVTTQRDIAPFKRVYLCSFHRSLWDAAMAKEKR